jgi:hypothetical protein
MRKIVLSGVAAIGFLVVGTIVVTHPTSAIRQADAETVVTCAAPHAHAAMADAGNGNRPQRVLVSGEQDNGAEPRPAPTPEVTQVPPC